ncbi:MAG: gamma-glutamylcyclotransferase [Candidatus Thorarchaeota archaeon]
MNDRRMKLIGYGSFMKDVLEQLAENLSPSTWGEPVTVLGPIVVNGFQRLWPGESYRAYPIVVPSEASSFIGLLLEISEKQLPRFDRIEGAPHLYERETIIMEWKDSQISAFLYVAGIKLINMIFEAYEVQSRKPGPDDWLDHLRNTLSQSAKGVFPEIFSLSD